ncbi:hypothetical protein ACFOSC_29090 [Streptantibioticus rubrisoli]|uniref:Uncharacterized protein n=1 Tax=Streptantibioticus rubrisoli TaxID=1387313 RepID=A0ABT1P6U6_9ACTN|nr:hypothetical protein [Streptantibioticus rubrisoli]MCQ4040471.1 hypothetical protein [Streptantibioticus rubrisoli]
MLSGDRVDVRLFFRPLAAEGATDADASWEQGWRTLTRLEQRDRAHLERARGLGDLFRPRSRQAAFGLCLAASVQPLTVGRVKVYFDTLAAGTERNRQVLAEALNRIGLGAAWSWLQEHDPAGMTHLMPAFFALDVDGSPDARVKFYTTVAERSASQLAARLAPFSDTARRTAAGFLENTAVDAAEALAQPGVRPTLCWSMTARCHHRPVDATLYLPFNQYAPEGGQTLGRLRKTLAPRHFRAIERLVTRHAAVVPPNEPENPFHWAATKLVRDRESLTLYISAAAVDAARTAGH